MNFGTVLLINLLIVAAALVALYFFGRKMQRRQAETQTQMEAMKQTVSMLIIDKKKLKIKESGLPQVVIDQTPKYMRLTKYPIVKPKDGKQKLTLVADNPVWDNLPVKQVLKVELSGIYITAIKSGRGGKIPSAPKKQGFFARFRKNK